MNNLDVSTHHFLWGMVWGLGIHGPVYMVKCKSFDTFPIIPNIQMAFQLEKKTWETEIIVSKVWYYFYTNLK